MISTDEAKVVARSIKRPVCETLGGTRTHLRLASMDRLRLLCRVFGCGVQELERRLYSEAVAHRREPTEKVVAWVADSCGMGRGVD